MAHGCTAEQAQAQAQDRRSVSIQDQEACRSLVASASLGRLLQSLFPLLALETPHSSMQALAKHVRRKIPNAASACRRAHVSIGRAKNLRAIREMRRVRRGTCSQTMKAKMGTLQALFSSPDTQVVQKVSLLKRWPMPRNWSSWWDHTVFQ